jgi:hypothetical protein
MWTSREEVMDVVAKDDVIVIMNKMELYMKDNLYYVEV